MERSSIVVLGLVLVFAAAILLSARKRRTTERHTFSWLLVCGGIVGLAVWRDGIDTLAEAMGIYYPPAALFFIALGGLVWVVYRLSLQVAEQREQIKRLAREVAVLSAAQPEAVSDERLERQKPAA